MKTLIAAAAATLAISAPAFAQITDVEAHFASEFTSNDAKIYDGVPGNVTDRAVELHAGIYAEDDTNNRGWFGMSGRVRFGCLALPQRGVAPATGQQRVMRAAFHHLARFQHDDLIGIDNGRQPVGNGQHSAPLAHGPEFGLNVTLGLGIKGRGRFVQQQNRRIAQDRAGDSNPLFLPTREHHSPLPDICAVSVGKCSEEFIRRGGLGGGFDLSV